MGSRVSWQSLPTIIKAGMVVGGVLASPALGVFIYYVWECVCGAIFASPPAAGSGGSHEITFVIYADIFFGRITLAGLAVLLSAGVAWLIVRLAEKDQPLVEETTESKLQHMSWKLRLLGGLGILLVSPAFVVCLKLGVYACLFRSWNYSELLGYLEIELDVAAEVFAPSIFLGTLFLVGFMVAGGKFVIRNRLLQRFREFPTVVKFICFLGGILFCPLLLSIVFLSMYGVFNGAARSPGGLFTSQPFLILMFLASIGCVVVFVAVLGAVLWKRKTADKLKTVEVGRQV